MSHKKATTIVLLPIFILSFLFITGAGLYLLDLADYIANNIGIVFGGVAEVFILGWLFTPEKLRLEANRYSNFGVGKWWNFCLKFITLIVLGFTMVSNLYKYLFGEDHYEGYPLWIGCMITAIMIVVTIILTKMRGKDSFYQKPADAPGWDD